MTFLRNTWYVAAWDDELKPGKLLHRRLLDEPLCLFRDSKGTVHALMDRCPHRFAPLHLGKLDGDAIQCGYHGLKFNGHGVCVHNPHGPIPRAASVRSYPAAERYSFVWVWMGDAAEADEKLIPDFGFQDPAHWYVGKDYLYVKSGYLLEVDNIMDLSHTEFLHATTLGSSGISTGEFHASQDGDTVWSKRLTRAEIMQPELSVAMGVPPGAPADRWLHVRWNAPANMALYAGAVPTGRPHEEGRETPTSHCFTPETATTTHYWFAICFPRAMGGMGENLAREQIAYIRAPFEAEDLPMLQAQQASLGDADLLDMKPLLLAGDAGGVRARRQLAKLLKAENAGNVSADAGSGASGNGDVSGTGA
jgi:vanillate O-demethylase monooxygenase subunit